MNKDNQQLAFKSFQTSSHRLQIIGLVFVMFLAIIGASYFIFVQASNSTAKSIVLIGSHKNQKLTVRASGSIPRNSQLVYIGPLQSDICSANLFRSDNLFTYNLKVYSNQVEVNSRTSGKYYCFGLEVNQRIIAFEPMRVNYSFEHRFDRGRIIDDEIFIDADSMSVADIQAFLKAVVSQSVAGNGFCDRYGALSGKRSNQAKYTCLFEYQYNPITRQDNYGQFDINDQPQQFVNGLSAAQIIWQAAQEYQVNPQVILALLQREQALVTNIAPEHRQFQYATGFACPDTTGCSQSASSFYTQVKAGAWALRKYFYHARQNLYKYPHYGYTSIATHPNSSCPLMKVNVVNPATAALYTYTPYTLITKSLQADYSEINCRSTGNYNFWLFFNQYFGSSIDPQRSTETRTQEDIRITPLHTRDRRPYLDIRDKSSNKSQVFFIGPFSDSDSCYDLPSNYLVFSNYSLFNQLIRLRHSNRLDVNMRMDGSYYCFGRILDNRHFEIMRSIQIDYFLLSKNFLDWVETVMFIQRYE